MKIKTRWGGSDVAYTDNRTVFINLNNEIICNIKDFQKRYLCLLGLLGHELGHVLYTDFEKMGKAAEGEYSELGLSNNEMKIMDKIQQSREKGFNAFLTELNHNILNCIEDGFVNRKISELFPGTFKEGIKELHLLQFASDEYGTTDNKLADSVNLILYLSLGIRVPEKLINSVPYYNKIKNEFVSIIPEETDGRISRANRLMIILWPLISELLKKAKKEKKSSESQDSDSSKDSSHKDSSHKDSSSKDNSSKNNSANKSSSEYIKQTEDKIKTSSEIGRGTGILNDNDSEEKEQITESNNSTIDSLPVPNECENNNTQKNSPNINDELSEYVSSYIRKNPEMVEKILQRNVGMKIFGDETSPHFGYPFEITYPNTLNRGGYLKIYSKIKGVSSRLQKRILSVLEEENEGGVCKNLLKGNKINPTAAASSSGKIFKRNILPEHKDIAVSVLIDESGSMSGVRCEKAREMAIIIEDFCRNLGIPLSVVGHCDSGKVIIKNYVSFEDNNQNRKYKLINIGAGGCNRDGFALGYCVKNLLERDEENKLLILVSDGKPNSEKYHGYSAEKDLSNLKKEFERKGGRLIAAAIGEDKDIISRIYGNSFLDVTDINNLPIKMIKLIAQYVQK